MKFQRSWTPALLVAIVSLTAGGWLLQQSGGDQDSVFFKARLLDQVHRLVAERYVEQVDPAELYQMAIDGMLYELGDPYTVFLTEDDFQDLHLSTTGNYGGLGIRIDEQGGWITVVGVLPNTPAEKRGLQTGDRIIEVEGESAEGWTPEDAVARLRGERGEPVTITIARFGVTDPIRFTIVRDDIHVESTNAFIVTPTIGFVRLNQFSKEAVAEMREAIDELIDGGMTGMVLDLRSNPGGLLDEGVAIADLFLPKGAEVVATQSRLKDQNNEFDAPGPEVYPGLRIVVLVNRFSASASEIVAGALQDHDRALVLGETTFGKGSVQTLYSLPGNNHLKLTTAGWYTPTGRSIHRSPADRFEFDGMIASAVSVDGTPIAPEDLSGREPYYTDSGRVVYGGGGITPDLIVLPDTLTTSEQQFRQAVVDGDVMLADATFQFALRWLAEDENLSQNFQVSPAMRDAFFDYLTEELGAQVSRADFDAAESYIDWELGNRIASVAFDEDARLLRSLRRNTQVATAIELLSEASTTEELFVLADARKALHPDPTKLSDRGADAGHPAQTDPDAPPQEEGAMLPSEIPSPAGAN